MPTLKRSLNENARLHAALQEEIANTYLKSSVKSAQSSPKPNKPPLHKKRSPIRTLPWIIACLALAGAGAIFISQSNIDIKVRVVRGIALVTRDNPVGDFDLSLDNAFFLVRGGQPAKDAVSSAFFVGDARSSSAMTDDTVILANTKGSGLAELRIECARAADLLKNDIKYTARGETGKERLVLLVTDAQNRTYRVQDDRALRISKDWKTFTVNFRAAKGIIDFSNVTTIRFEFGSFTAGNDPAAVIEVKDIYLTKNRGIKWR